MAKRGSVLLGAAMLLSAAGCAGVVGIQELPPATDRSGSTSSARSSSSSSASNGVGIVPIDGSCHADADCSQSECTASCVDWSDGNGAICSCNCDWGTDCRSGCCWQVDSGAFYACRAAAACVPINGACTANYQCVNNNCGAYKTYCLSSACACGCTLNTDCVSGCCTTYSSTSLTADICNDLQTNCMAR